MAVAAEEEEERIPLAEEDFPCTFLHGESLHDQRQRLQVRTLLARYRRGTLALVAATAGTAAVAVVALGLNRSWSHGALQHQLLAPGGDDLDLVQAFSMPGLPKAQQAQITAQAAAFARKRSELGSEAQPSEVAANSMTCSLEWDEGVDTMVGRGWGAAFFQAAGLGDLLQLDGCDLAFSVEAAREWEAWGLGLPGRPLKSWQSASGTNDERIEAAMGQWRDRWRDFLHVFWAGCGPHFDEIVGRVFSHRIAATPRPFAGSAYLGAHVRHGDKVVHGNIFSFEDILGRGAAAWPELRRVFLATDDADVLAQSGDYSRQGFAFKWSNYSRQSGGEPFTYDGQAVSHHDTQDSAVAAVLADTVALAQASAIVGNWNSMFFKLGWLLNYLRRTPAERQQFWCWDVFSNQDCSSRRDFVVAFCQQVMSHGLQYDVACNNMQEIQDCPVPT